MDTPSVSERISRLRELASVIRDRDTDEMRTAAPTQFQNHHNWDQWNDWRNWNNPPQPGHP